VQGKKEAVFGKGCVLRAEEGEKPAGFRIIAQRDTCLRQKKKGAPEE